MQQSTGGRAMRKAKPVQTGGRRHPTPPLPKQHQPNPGLEATLSPPPQYEAPTYKGSGKLLDMVALITGGDSGIGRAVAVLYGRKRATTSIVYLSDEQQDAERPNRPSSAKGGNACSSRETSGRGVLSQGGRPHRARVRSARHPGQQRGVPGARGCARGAERRTF